MQQVSGGHDQEAKRPTQEGPTPWHRVTNTHRRMASSRCHHLFLQLTLKTCISTPGTSLSLQPVPGQPVSHALGCVALGQSLAFSGPQHSHPQMKLLNR